MQETKKKGSLDISEMVFCVLCSLFTLFVVLTNTIGVKLFQVGGLSLPTSCLWYPFTFLITDIVSEFYGAKRGYFIVAMGFVASLVVMAVSFVSIHLPASPLYPAADAFETVFTTTWRLVFASMCAYLFAQAVDVKIFEWIHQRTGPGRRWMRNNGSTLISQAIDTVTVQYLFLWNNEAVFQGSLYDLFIVMSSTYLVKVVFAALDTPFFYLITSIVRRKNWI